ncbi:MAG: dipeptide ABC transporter ATP-binding protein [Pseudomonadota bacterium]|nr:dipeptide ABC transporter ATP-binding protein [Pseudomonadota bacterium]
MTEAILSVEQLKIGFKTRSGITPVVKGVNFRIGAGETLALVGESGSGKSLTALAIMQLLPPNAVIDVQSTVRLAQTDLLTQSEVAMRKVRGRRIGMIFQDAMAALNPVLTIGQQIEEVLHFHLQLPRRMRHARVLTLLDEVGIAEPESCAESYPHQLSGGMKQRAMIAMALACEPELLIADEPTTALDVTIQAQVLHLLRDLQAQRGMSMLFITHNLGIVYEMADTVAVMRQGEIVEHAQATAFFKQPQHEYSRALFSAVADWRIITPSDPPTCAPIVQVDDLKIHFPIRAGIFKRVVGYVKAVDGISFDLYPGRTLALIGESGSGKTTAGLGMLRLTNVTSGKILYEDHNIVNSSRRQLKSVRSDLQIIFQDPHSSMNPRMLIKDIIAEGMVAQCIGKTTVEREARVAELLMKVGLLPEHMYRYPHEFSGGQRQRICIARALALEPKLIVCDEPTSALDVSAQQRVLDLLQTIQRDTQIAYLLITHDFAVVAKMAHDIAVMYHGKIVEAGSVQQILSHPQHPYTQQLLAAVPRINHSHESLYEDR